MTKTNTFILSLALIAIANLAAAFSTNTARAQATLAVRAATGVQSHAAGSPQRENPDLHFVDSKKSNSIAVLVNDEPITNWEIEQRQAFLGMSAKGINSKAQVRFKQLLKSSSTTDHLKAMIKKIVAANPGKSKDEIIAIINKRKQQYARTLQARAVSSARASVLPGLRKKATEELIDERLQLQEAKRLNLVAADTEVEGIVTNLAKRNKMTLPQFSTHLKKQGSNLTTMKNRFKAMLSWRSVVRSRFGHQVSVKSGDVDRMVEQAALDTATNSQFKLQRITLGVPPDAKAGILAQRLSDAGAIRNEFSGCKNTGALVTKFGGARLENLGERSAADIKEPARSMIQSAGDDEMLPPLMSKGAVHLWVVCGRKTVDAKIGQRAEATKSLQLQELDVLGQRHLKDLRQDAHIEYR